MVKSYESSFILAVRVFLVGTKQGAELRKLMEEFAFKELFPKEEQIVSRLYGMFGGYTTICSLETKSDSVTMSDIMQCTKLVQVMRRLSFFENIGEQTEETEVNRWKNFAKCFYAQCLNYTFFKSLLFSSIVNI